MALGRKNWLACGSEIGGETAAIAYSMIGGAVINGVNPVAWLTDVLERVPTVPPDRLIELLPDRWKAARASSGTSPDASAPAQHPAKIVTSLPSGPPGSAPEVDAPA